MGKSVEEAGTCWKSQKCSVPRRALPCSPAAPSCCLTASLCCRDTSGPLPEGCGSTRGHGRGLDSPTDGISPVFSRILDIAKALRLRVSKAKGVPGLENDQNHKLGTLSLPLPMQKAPEGQRKRRKMN